MILLMLKAFAVISILATMLLTWVVFKYTDDNPEIQANRSRKIELGLLAIMLVMNFALVAFINGYNPGA